MITALGHIIESIALITVSIMLTMITMLIPVIVAIGLGWEPSAVVLGIVFFVLFWLILYALAEHAWRNEIRAFGSDRNRHVERTTVIDRSAPLVPITRNVVNGRSKRNFVSNAAQGRNFSTGNRKYQCNRSSEDLPIMASNRISMSDSGTSKADWDASIRPAQTILNARIKESLDTTAVVRPGTKPIRSNKKRIKGAIPVIETVEARPSITESLDSKEQKPETRATRSTSSMVDPEQNFDVELTRGRNESPSVSFLDDPDEFTVPVTGLKTETLKTTTWTTPTEEMNHASAPAIDESMLFSGRLITITRPTIED